MKNKLNFMRKKQNFFQPFPSGLQGPDLQEISLQKQPDFKLYQFPVYWHLNWN